MNHRLGFSPEVLLTTSVGSIRSNPMCAAASLEVVELEALALAFTDAVLKIDCNGAQYEMCQSFTAYLADNKEQLDGELRSMFAPRLLD